MTPAVFNLILIFSFLLALCLFALIYLYVSSKKAQPQIKIEAHSYLIIYASQSGQAQYFATQVAKQLNAANEDTVLVSAEHLQPSMLKQASKVIWLVSTYGEGDHPDTAQHMVQWLFDAKLDLNLSEQNFIVLGFGDRHYDHFCAFAQRVHHRLLELAAKPWQNVMTVDQLSPKDLNAFAEMLSQITRHRIVLSEQEKQWFPITLKQRALLNTGSQGTGLYHLSFAMDKSIEWKSGDLLEIKCQNTTKDLTLFMAQHPELSDIDAETLKFKNLRRLETKSANVSNVEWVNNLENLPIREYSIASIASHGQLELVVRQEINEGELGLGSGLLTNSLNLNDEIYGSIRSNPSFHLNPQSTPAIFIGNGSGIAGLLAHLHQREKDGHQKNWLIYGERQSATDQIFDIQISKWQSQNILSKVDRAYSRDADAPYKYVQDVLKVHANEIKTWIEDGATIYICGSLKGMATDVHKTLESILGSTKLNELLLEHRYCRDVY